MEIERNLVQMIRTGPPEVLGRFWAGFRRIWKGFRAIYSYAPPPPHIYIYITNPRARGPPPARPRICIKNILFFGKMDFYKKNMKNEKVPFFFRTRAAARRPE